jgi:hypothetical protein
MAITFSLAGFWVGLFGVLVAIGRYRLAVIGFVVLMAPSVGPLVFASLIAFARTTKDLRPIYEEQHRAKHI